VGALLLGTVGCGGSGEATQSKTDDEGSTIRRPTKLAELDPDTAVPGLDGGRVEVTPPLGWHRAPRDADRWLIRFNREADSAYPTIMVNVEQYEDVLNVTDDNLAEFAKQIAAAMEGTKFSQEIEPIVIGDFRGITYQRRARVPYDYDKIVVDRVFVETVVDSRKYKLELLAKDGTWQRSEPHLHAMAAGLIFPKKTPPEPPTEKTPTEKTPAEKTPAEKTPAEKTPAEKTPAEKTPAEKTPAEKTPAEKTPDPPGVDEDNPEDNPG